MFRIRRKKKDEDQHPDDFVRLCNAEIRLDESINFDAMLRCYDGPRTSVTLKGLTCPGISPQTLRIVCENPLLGMQFFTRAVLSGSIKFEVES